MLFSLRVVVISVFLAGTGISFPLYAVCFVLAFTTGGQANSATQTQRPRVELDEMMVRETVETVAAVVDREYFDREVASRVEKGLRDRLQLGRYTVAESAEELAQLLTEHLYAMTRDKHLSVNYIPPDDDTRVSSEARQQSRESRARRQNYGVERIQILPGNIGYLNFTAFYRPVEAREALEAAMESLRYADALILDMRTNGGGKPSTVALLASYLFETPGKLLFEIVPREGETKSYFTESVRESHRDGRRPVFVLTAATTFSGGEGLAFILQEQGRAVVVGKVTAGAANSGRPYPVSDYFEVVVPNGQVRSAVTGRNWEGTGVIPDIPATEVEALQVSHRLALQELLETTNDEKWADTLRKELRRTPPR